MLGFHSDCECNSSRCDGESRFGTRFVSKVKIFGLFFGVGVVRLSDKSTTDRHHCTLAYRGHRLELLGCTHDVVPASLIHMLTDGVEQYSMLVTSREMGSIF